MGRNSLSFDFLFESHSFLQSLKLDSAKFEAHFGVVYDTNPDLFE